MITLKVTKAEFDCLQQSLKYLVDSEKTHFEESDTMHRQGIDSNHVYMLAKKSLEAINTSAQ